MRKDFYLDYPSRCCKNVCTPSPNVSSGPEGLGEDLDICVSLKLDDSSNSQLKTTGFEVKERVTSNQKV